MHGPKNAKLYFKVFIIIIIIIIIINLIGFTQLWKMYNGTMYNSTMLHLVYNCIWC
jgi:hypothetical protein